MFKGKVCTAVLRKLFRTETLHSDLLQSCAAVTCRSRAAITGRGPGPCHRRTIPRSCGRLGGGRRPGALANFKRCVECLF